MPVSNVKNYLFVLLGGLVLLGAVILIGLQWGNSTDTFSLYGRTTTVNLALLMLFSAVGGVLVWYTGRLLFRGMFGIWKYRRQQKKLDRMAEKRVADRQQSSGSTAPAESGTSQAPGSSEKKS
jgi:uncharacterized integral membrane protein